MGNAILQINGIEISSDKITYEDLIVLYNEFIEIHGRVPLLKDCLSKNNLPQGRIVNKLLLENGVTYNDFMNLFGKVSKVRTDGNSDYDFYVRRFIDTCKKLNRTLTSNELCCNNFGLPSSSWFIKYCPNKNVKKYTDFILYCGLSPTKHIWTKDEVSRRLLKYEKELGRPITKQDINQETVGFSTIVVTRLYGGLNNAKNEIGLQESTGVQPMPFSYYKQLLSNVVMDYKEKTNNKYISWNDIECGKYGKYKANHKSISKAFSKEGINIHEFIKSLGCVMNPSDFSFTYTFDNGERVSSKYEYETTNLLRHLGFKYQKDYFRGIRYKEFSNVQSRMDCDYDIIINEKHFYIEVAGIISNYNNDWRSRNFTTRIEREYQKKMILKENTMINNGLSYLFLFPEDYNDDSYIEKISNFLNIDG